MITIKPNSSVQYSQVENRDKVIFYPQFYSVKTIDKFIDRIEADQHNKVIKKIQTNLQKLTNKLFSPGFTSIGAIAYISLGCEPIYVNNNGKKLNIPCLKGSVVIFGEQFRCIENIDLPLLAIKLYDHDYMSEINLSIDDRLSYAEKVRQNIKLIHTLPIWSQCVQKVLDLELVGKGSYGNVFKSCIEGRPFAVKISKLKPEAIKKPYDLSVNSWHEVYYLKNIIRLIIENKKCPNLPLLFDNFLCDNCEIVIDGKKLKNHCITTIVELADGDLKKYLQTNREEKEIYSTLFQIMVAVHSIQMNGQIMNFDVKKENILYYNVKPGGCWKYTIRNKDYYVPNFGKLFILNDFGISRPMSPDFPIYKDGTFRLGSRYAVIEENKFVPLNVERKRKKKKENKIKWGNKQKSEGIEISMSKKNGIDKIDFVVPKETIEYLHKNKIPFDSSNPDFYRYPDIIPPFEFYNDTQDVIRMFAGGKRTTQKGNHRCYPTIPKKIVKELKEYIGKGSTMKDNVFDVPEKLLAGRFIESFFGKREEYFRQNGKVIDTYKI